MKNSIYSTTTKTTITIILVLFLGMLLLNSGLKELVVNHITDSITDQFSENDTVKTFQFMNKTAMDSIETIGNATGTDLTSDVSDLANQAVNEFNTKMDQVANGTYDAKAELTNITNAGINAAKTINNETNLISNEDASALKNELVGIATDKINQVQNGEFNAEEELKNITEKGAESLDTINQAGKESLESLDESTKEYKENKQVKNMIKKVSENETVKNAIKDIKEKIAEVF